MSSLPPIVVVFDLNVYLDVARLIDEPYSKSKLQLKMLNQPTAPTRQEANQFASGKAVLFCSTGIFAGLQKVEVWTNTWIEKGIVRMAQRQPHQDGLGWSEVGAKGLYQDLLMDSLVKPSKGQSLQADKRAKYGDLSWDDSQVLHTALQAASFGRRTYCVTGDREFRRTTVSNSVEMLTPTELVKRMKDLRTAIREATNAPSTAANAQATQA